MVSVKLTASFSLCFRRLRACRELLMPKMSHTSLAANHGFPVCSLRIALISVVWYLKGMMLLGGQLNRGHYGVIGVRPSR